jgi:hypothetical protein
MRRTKFDYRSYHGKRTATDWLKWIALILAILAALAVAVLLWGQKYFTYTDEGLRLTLPFLQQEDHKPADPGQVDVVIEEVPEPKEDASHPAEPLQPEEATAAAAVPLSTLLDGSAATLAERAGANSVVVEMKDAQGRLGWQSEQPLDGAAKLPGAEAPGINEQLAAWNQGSLDTIARLSCFRDEALGSNMAHTIRTGSGYRWKDSGGLHWASPSDPEVRDYLVGLMVELARLGFDEIVLEHWGYPAQSDGPLGNIQSGDRYPAGELEPVAAAFLAQAAAALEPYDVRLSLAVSAGQLSGEDPGTGLTAEALNASVDRIWMEGGRTEALEALNASGVTGAEERLVSWSGALDPEETGAQAIWETDDTP